MANYNQEKHDRFKKIAEQRTNKILKTLKLLGNCSHKGNYYYTDEEVKKIFGAIERELRNTRNKFQDQQQDEYEFKL